MDVVNLAHRLRRDYPIIIIDDSAHPLASISRMPDAVFILRSECESDIRNYKPSKPKQKKSKTTQEAPKKEEIKSSPLFNWFFNYFG